MNEEKRVLCVVNVKDIDPDDEGILTFYTDGTYYGEHWPTHKVSQWKIENNSFYWKHDPEGEWNNNHFTKAEDDMEKVTNRLKELLVMEKFVEEELLNG